MSFERYVQVRVLPVVADEMVMTRWNNNDPQLMKIVWGTKAGLLCSYGVADDMELHPGDCVVVPFGASTSRIGHVIGEADRGEVDALIADGVTLKAVGSVIGRG